MGDKCKTEGYMKYRAARLEREYDFFETIKLNAETRAKRSPQQQITVLDERLGSGQGAKRERARLLGQIEAAKSKPKKKRGKNK